MPLLDMFDNTIWALLPEKYHAIRAVLENHEKGHRIDLGAVRHEIEHARADVAAAFKLVRPTQVDGLNIYDSVAVIPIYGVMAQRMDFFTAISGGASMSRIRAQIFQALEAGEVKAILLDVDSPGGSVDGTVELMEAIYRARGTKPIHAYSSGMMTSAAYWVSSAVDRLMVIDTAKVGSIGVITSHVDYSQYYEKQGVKVTYLTAGKYKKVGNQAEPLSKGDKDYIQARLDYLYSIFVDGVARNRGVTPENVLERMADARIFVGAQSVKAGLVDAIGTIDDAMESVRTAIERAGRLEVTMAAARRLEAARGTLEAVRLETRRAGNTLALRQEELHRKLF